MTRIFIEGQELDVNEGFSNQITYAVDDLINLDSKSTSFSKTIVLPGTSKNNRLLGNIFEFSNSNFTDDTQPNVGYNFNAAKSAKARIENDGLLIIKGVLRLLEIIVDGQNIEYEVAIFGELGGFITKLGNLKLENLDFSEYNHVYNITNIRNSWDTANAGEGYYYPLIDYGNVSYNLPSATNTTTSQAKKDYQYTAFRPALYVKEYIDKIIHAAGYTWDSTFFNTDFFKRLIIPNNDSGLYKANLSNYASGVTSASFSANSYGTGPVFAFAQLKFPSPTLDSSVTYNSSTGEFTYIGGNPTTVKIKLSVTYTHSRNGGSAFIKLYRNNAGSVIEVTKYTCIVGTQTVDVEGITDLVNGNTFYVRIESTCNTQYGSIFQNWFSLMSVTSGATLNVEKEPPGFIEYTLGDTIKINEVLPKNILQKDFFTSIMKLFNLMVYEDKYTEKKLMIEPWVDFYDLDRTTYLDWSNKIDRSQPIKIKPMSEINSRFYEFKYKSDNDFYNEKYRKAYNRGYGDRIYDNNLEFAKDTSTTEIIFAATPLVGYALRDKVVSTIFKMNNNVEDRTESIIRILQAKKITDVNSWKVLNANTTLGTYTVYPYAGHFDDPDVPAADLNFGATEELYFDLASGALSNNMFNAYYSSYLAEITDKDSRLLTANFRLKSTDIFNLDFGKFIWIDGVLYRLVKISDYVEGELCKVELLRVIYTTYSI